MMDKVIDKEICKKEGLVQTYDDDEATTDQRTVNSAVFIPIP